MEISLFPLALSSLEGSSSLVLVSLNLLAPVIGNERILTYHGKD